MRVLSVRQPSAWAICAGHKLIENRIWSTSYRGRLLIHAGRIVDQGAIDRLRALGIEVPHDLITSAIIGSVVLDDIVPIDMVADDPFASGPWCWLLSSPRFLPAPVPMPGQLRLFEVELERLGTGPAEVVELAKAPRWES